MAPKKAILLTVLAALFCLANTARAALQFDAFLGYDDIMPERSWFPITCELQNDGPSFNAVIEVSAEEFGPGGLVRRFPIDLPTNTRKRICIPVFSTTGRWHVRLLDERGKLRGEQLLDHGRTIKNSLPLVAGLARTSAGLPVFPEFVSSMNQDSKYSTARLQPALFPDNPLALEGIDLLYLSSERAANMDIGQVNALVAWLQHGGHLVLGVEQLADVNATPWLHDLLPCELTSITTLNSHDALTAWARSASQTPLTAPVQHNAGANHHQNYPSLQPNPPAYVPGQAWADDPEFDSAPLQAATGSPRDGTYLIGDAAAPLAIEGIRGRGKITVLMFDPEREPVISWKNRGWLWAGLAGIPANIFQAPYGNIRASRLSSDGIFGSMIDTKQVRKLPLGWLLVLLAAYLAVIGPLDQYWLKKINRQMLTWVTFPCYVLIFSGLIYYIGFHLRAGELEWNELNIVDILPDSDRAVLRGETYVSIYSPINSDYELAGQEKFASLRGEYLGNFGGSQESSRAEVVQTGNNFDAEAYVPVWTSQLLVSDWVQPSPLPLKMTVGRDGGDWKVTVENKLDHGLEQASVVLGGVFYNIGPLSASQSKTFTLSPRQGTPVDEMARQFQGPFQSAVQSRHNSFGNNAVAVPDIVAGTMAVSFIGYIDRDSAANDWNNFSSPSTLDLSRFADGDFGILLAWDAGQTLTPDLNRFQPKRLRRDTLLRLVVPVSL
ncbi:MAG TPA: hypothetical protein VH619_01105 [Verrucomicrobiae bacterium]|jgi:hypothetical protein|nr:hypothetical protein [Verrucomicrobiae bacterium]